MDNTASVAELNSEEEDILADEFTNYENLDDEAFFSALRLEHAKA